ncbi:gap junction beta-4 protein-like [Chelydra serpentina]|uniref:Gap junction beta-4 protein-like n=1 Tax=Chelydra serpentina TaxID=8475 RepID=A0A8T1T1V8_CHESE|nr:gap junction beta-4 protein-like [Chelydra serpentina]
MEVDTVASLLSGTSAQAPRLCRAGLAAVFALRLGALAAGAGTLWRDEVGDLACNASGESCRHTCFAAAFPVSPFSLFALQLAVIFSHALASSWHGRPHGEGSWLQPTQQRLWLHLGSLLAKAVLEGVFLVTFHMLYSHFPVLVQCPPAPCPPAVTCAILNAREKDAFNHFMAGSSWAGLLLSLLGTQHAAVQIFQEASGKAPRKGTARKPCV